MDLYRLLIDCYIIDLDYLKDIHLEHMYMKI